MKRTIQVLTLMVFVFSLFVAWPSGTVQAAPKLDQDRFWCGNGSAPNYGFDTHGYALTQKYWTIDMFNLVSEQTKRDVDVVLNKLDGDKIVQTMILVLPEDQVGEPVNCAVHFVRYMKLGLPDGPNKDNGFVWLVITHPGSVEVRYGVGLGLNALTAPGLGDLKRVGVDAYASSQSVDTAIIELVKGFDTYSRSKYQVGGIAASEAEVANTTPTGSGSSGIPWWGWLLIILFILILAGALGGGGGGGSGTSTTHYDSSPSPSHSDSSSSHTGSGSGAANRGG